jgi:NADH:ubiquinone oxidoreductase subunit 4 (subunit M)
MTEFSLGYILLYVWQITFGTPNHEELDVVPFSMKASMIILMVLIILGVWPTFFIDLINTVGFG